MPAKKKATTKNAPKTKPATDSQTIDVTNKKPSKPSTGSRPVIIGHKNKIQDSMVKSKSTPVTEKKTGDDSVDTLGVTTEEIKEALTVPTPAEPEVEEEQPEEKIIKIPESKGDKPELPKEMQLDEEGDGKPKEVKKNKNEESSQKNDSPKVPPVVTEEKQEEKEAESKPEPEETLKEPTEDDVPEVEESAEDEDDSTEEVVEDEETSPDKPDDEVQVGQEDEGTAEDSEVEVGSGDESSNEGIESSVQEPEGGLVDELAKQAADKKQQKEQDKQASVREEKVTALINSKQYYVPIVQVAKRRIKHIIIAILLLAIVLLGLNFAIDAELLDVGIQPLTNIL